MSENRWAPFASVFSERVRDIPEALRRLAELDMRLKLLRAKKQMELAVLASKGTPRE